jgi:outer membrane lipoprotein-sorting protein
MNLPNFRLKSLTLAFAVALASFVSASAQTNERAQIIKEISD